MRYWTSWETLLEKANENIQYYYKIYPYAKKLNNYFCTSFLAYCEMLKRLGDFSIPIKDLIEMPLGSGALANINIPYP